MPRDLSYIHDEIIRVSKSLDLDPRSRGYSRSVFLKSDVDHATDVTKHDLEHYGGWIKLRQDAAHSAGIPISIDRTASRGVELRNNYVRGLERKLATSEYFREKLEENLEDVFSKNTVKLSTSVYVTSSKTPNRIITLLWSDLHFGVDVQDYEVYKSKFNWEVASRRLAKLCVEAVDWRGGRPAKLRIILNGDIMQGVIHLNDANIRPMTEQIWGATAILTSALDFLRKYFADIEVMCLPGNHDRMTYKDSGRSTCQRWDSHAHSIYLCLQQTFRADKGVSFLVPTTGIGVMDDLDQGCIIAAHGDTEPDPKNVSKKIDTEALTIKLLKLKDSEAIEKRVSVALFGHWHTPTIQMLPSGTTIIVNGSLIGSEPFGQNVIGEFNSMPAQVMLDTIPGSPANSVKIIQVGGAENDKSLSKIIPTPKIIVDGNMAI